MTWRSMSWQRKTRVTRARERAKLINRKRVASCADVLATWPKITASRTRVRTVHPTAKTKTKESGWTKLHQSDLAEWHLGPSCPSRWERRWGVRNWRYLGSFARVGGQLRGRTLMFSTRLRMDYSRTKLESQSDISEWTQAKTLWWASSTDETSWWTQNLDHVSSVWRQWTHHECGHVLYQGERPIRHVHHKWWHFVARRSWRDSDRQSSKSLRVGMLDQTRKRVGISANWRLQWKSYRTCRTSFDSPAASRCRDPDVGTVPGSVRIKSGRRIHQAWDPSGSVATRTAWA